MLLEMSAERLIAWIPAVLIALTFHEFAHGWVAKRLGDYTAARAGRLTLNPIPHLDPIGTLLLFVVGFGWAKPVPVNPYNFHGDIKRGMMLVSLAGPGTNLVVAIAGAVILGVVMGTLHLTGDPHSMPAFGNFFLVRILDAVILVNLILAVFNLLPVPPLDGSKILAGLLPGRQEWLYNLERFGILILLVLVFTGAIRALFSLVIAPVHSQLLSLAFAIARTTGS
ncbi:MAG: site-2 protease family protein [Bacillota bacterium]